MNNTALTLSFALVTAGLSAQQMSNEVLRNNQPYLVIATATSAATGLNYNWDPVNPPEYSQGSLGAPVGVPANTWSFRVFRKETNYRFGARKVTGFTFLVRLSAETGNSWPNAYEPQCNLMGTVARPNAQVATALDPDWNKVLVSLPEMAMPANSNLTTVTRTLASTISVPTPGNESISLAMKFRGGESKWVNGAQGFCASWYDAPTQFIHWGFYYPPSNTHVYSTDPFFHLWATYMEEEPTIAMHSDWGQRRYSTTNGQLNPPLLGHSLGTYYSDIAARAGQLGISVRAANQPNGFAMTLFNFGPPLQIGFPILGQTIELNIADPLLSAFSGIANVGLFQLDGNGEVDGLKFNIPTNAAFAGTSMGFEALVADQFLNIAGSTGSAFIQN